MITEVEQINFLYVNVKIAQPFIDVAHVPLLDIFEFIDLPVNLAVQHGEFELAGVNLEVTIDNRESTPADYEILAGVFTGQIDQLEDKDVSRRQRL